MAAKQIIFPAHRAFNSDGAPEPGATAYLYLSGTTTPATFYSDVGLTVSLGSHLTANAAGRFVPHPYQDSTVAFRLVIEDAEGTVLDDIDPFFFGLQTGVDGANASIAIGTTTTGASGSSASVTNSGTGTNAILNFAVPAGIQGPAGDVAKVLTRTDLAAVPVPVAGMVRYLSEAGREGSFVWSSANNSANITADTAQGVYVAPATDITGASGAWVRHPGIDTWTNIKWFGAVADNATDTSAAFLAALAFRKSLSTSGFGDSRGGGDLFIPKGVYYLGTTTLDIYSAINLHGESAGSNGGPATVLRWADGATGIRVHNTITSGASTTRVADGFSGDGTTIEKLFLQGGFTTTESESHGIHARGKITVRDCYINLFSGDGIYGYATAGSGGATEGNINNSYVERVTLQGNRCGMFWQGADSSAGAFIGFNVLYNRRWGIWDNSFLGNAHFGHHASTNGLVNVGGSVPYVLVSYLGNLYSLVQGGNHANAPSGTTADTADWYYARSGGVGSYSPAWTNSVSVRDGGPYFSSTSAFRSCYSEGDQGVSQCVTGGLMDGYSQIAGVKGNGMYDKTVAGIAGGGAVAFKQLSGGLRVTGNNPNFSGPAGVELMMFGSSAYIQTIDRAAGNVFQPLIINSGGTTLQVSGTTTATVGSTGINLASGKFLQFNGTTILNGTGVLQAAGFPALTGDVTTAGAALATTIANNAVTYAKFQQVAASSLVGNATGSLANATGITLSADLAFSGSTLQVGAFTGDIAKTAGSLATTVAANAITYAKFQQVAASSLVGNATGSLANATGITLGATLTFSGSALQTAAMTGDITASANSFATTIAANAVTYAKFQQVAASSLVGNATGSLANATGITLAGGLAFSGSTLTAAGALTPTSVASTGAVSGTTISGSTSVLSTGTGGVGYATGAGGAVTQLTSRVTGVTLNKTCGAITLFSAAGSATWTTFTVTNSTVAATDVIDICQKSGANLYSAIVTAVGAGTFNVSISAVSGTATEAPVFNFNVTKAVAA